MNQAQFLEDEDDESPEIGEQYLLARGFSRTTVALDVVGFPNVDEWSMTYHETGYNRQMFVVQISREVQNGEEESSTLVWVQEDAGCGFVLIPNAASNYTQRRFEALYLAVCDRQLAEEESSHGVPVSAAQPADGQRQRGPDEPGVHLSGDWQ